MFIPIFLFKLLTMHMFIQTAETLVNRGFVRLCTALKLFGNDSN
jgi:hypothetical protein